ncbi:MAG: DinB family protein [Bacteroidetes bacterium]|nr:MAG: DinB family protein [Bacteroidota bacterium]
MVLTSFSAIQPVRLFALAFFLLTAPRFLLAQTDAFLAESVKKWDNAMAYTLETARAIPDSVYGFKPTPEMFSFAEQLDHIGRNMTWLAGDYLLGKKFEHPLLAKEHRLPAETLELLEASLAFAREAIATTPADSLEVTRKFFAGPMTRRQIIALMHDHHTHHRGQLVVYLRLNGVKPPRYRGW